MLIEPAPESAVVERSRRKLEEQVGEERKVLNNPQEVARAMEIIAAGISRNARERVAGFGGKLGKVGEMKPSPALNRVIAAVREQFANK